jgi:CheY-like chemotaxis protein
MIPTILIIDDVPQSRLLVGKILEHAGYIIHTASNGAEGLEMVEQVQPDVILTDIMMPHMNGVEFLEHLRADARYTHVPVIVVSAVANYRVDWQAWGANGYLSMPFNPQDLLDAVESLLIA